MAETQLQQRGQQWLETFLKFADFPATVTAEVRETFAEKSCWLTIDHTALQPNQLEALLGSKGAVLDSIQYLASSILNIGQSEQMAYTIELNGYREKRHQELLEIAENAAAEVRETGREYEIKSLSSAERRQVHSILQGSEDIETFSRGQEPDRRLVVKLVGAGSDGD
ncbi:single-stranded nucleic acid binding R3H domain protein [Leptolyngbya boryana NIES-2135]|jgi:spoIIIJ-associated protein|uniref:Single-stranded nucleic acid binding R3H domain protein n=1 Tax=Leptolyngbya boryana NIES-2135 TaxID=1973484 RepID=A0A1Z4JA11_LEPBY|nr:MULTISPECIES: R3H domain-containing nucleic acid-binding protein [Leptolyngbya]BAY53625.1 single-stranded nucleic acid binding R3H domain protein [Leptolyngbya boryana NIES-2135]MBD2371315.1 RNA-binding protein [Leptolyngbya sp. FACHB-161]MBD2377794.1 RNA-binding protein [Leptolyngbya sp. FACHB-238]MBD2402231.1 RNA-binding protein [Leptolyngbya sp. FACHB-239]MBD2408724.1 RNA-binding protein [Leptolyngbya sp. FACHB-402]